MVEKEEEEDDLPQQTQSKGKDLDLNELKGKLQAVEKNRAMEPFKSKITVNLGLEEYDKGKNKITHEIFEGRDKTQNAELFIENLQKTKQRHLKDAKQNDK